MMMTSLTVEKPSYEKYMQFNNDIKLVWSDEVKYIVNQTTEFIYIGLKASDSAFCSIHYTINTDADIPMRYEKLNDGTFNSY